MSFFMIVEQTITGKMFSLSTIKWCYYNINCWTVSDGTCKEFTNYLLKLEVFNFQVLSGIFDSPKKLTP